MSATNTIIMVIVLVGLLLFIIGGIRWVYRLIRKRGRREATSMIVLGVSMFVIGTFISFVSHHQEDAAKAAKVSRSISASKKLDKETEDEYNLQNGDDTDTDVSTDSSQSKSSSSSKTSTPKPDKLAYFQKSLDVRVKNDAGQLVSAKATKQNSEYYTVKYVADQHLNAYDKTELQAYADELFDSTQKIAAMCGLKYKVGINLWSSDGSTIIARRNASGGVTVYPVAQ